MASGLYNRFKANLLQGYVDLAGSGSHDIKCALLTNVHAFNADHNIWSQISGNEVAGTGNYNTGGSSLTGKTVTQDQANDRGAFDAADVTWATSTITARFAVLYDNTMINKDLILCIDFASDYSSSAGNFTIQWHTDGIVLLT